MRCQGVEIEDNEGMNRISGLCLRQDWFAGFPLLRERQLGGCDWIPLPYQVWDKFTSGWSGRESMNRISGMISKARLV